MRKVYTVVEEPALIPLFKLNIGAAERQAMLEVVDSGHLTQGPRVMQLEEQFATATGARHAIAVSSGTTALHIALLAHEIGEGDEVITTPFTFIASVNSILYVGATPVFVDIDPVTFNLDPAQLAAVLTPRTRAIMPVDLYGAPCEMDVITEFAAQHGLAVIEDAAQAIGAAVHGQPVGSFCTTCFSLYESKNVTAGEGGVVTTNDDAIVEQCRLIRNHGMRRRYHHETLGYNSRLSDLHAAIAIPQMARLTEITAARQTNADYYEAAIHHPRVIKPQVRSGLTSAWNVYTLRVPEGRDALVTHLAAAGVEAGVFYPEPAHLQEHVAALGLIHGPLPETERAAREVLSLPVRPDLTAAEREQVVAAVNSWNGGTG